MSLSCDRLRLPALGSAALAATALMFAPTGASAAPVAPAKPAAAQVAGTSTAVQTAQTATAKTTAGKTTAGKTTAKPTAAQTAAARSAVIRAGVLRTAASLKGRPYRYGATGPRAFDCSGYTKYVYAKNGVSLPRTSGQQYRKAKKVSKASARPGDLVFFGRAGNIYHVAVYAGNGQIWHAPSSGKTVRKVKIWTKSWSAGRVV